jgi:hypothetical protein
MHVYKLAQNMYDFKVFKLKHSLKHCTLLLLNTTYKHNKKIYKNNNTIFKYSVNINYLNP